MALQGTCRQIGEVAIIDFSGKITLGEGSATLRKTIREMADGGQKKIVLNLADVDYIDSSGIGELVSGFTPCAAPAANSSCCISPSAFTTSCRSRASSPSSTSNPTKPTPSAASSSAAFNQRRTAPNPVFMLLFRVLIPFEVHRCLTIFPAKT